MRAFEFFTENKTTLNKLYGGSFPDRDETFWDYVGKGDFDKTLGVQKMPKHKLAIMLQSQYRVEHLDEILDMMDEDQREVLDRYMSDPNLSNKIIVVSDDRIIDGNHRALAAAMKGVSINYVDLADLDEQDVTEGFDKEAGAWRDWQLKMLPRKMEMLSRLVKGWVPSEEDHIAAIEAGYVAMRETGNVKDAAKAISDTFKEIQSRQDVTEGSEDKNAQQRKVERDKQRTAPAQKARNTAQRKGLTQDKDGTYYAKEGVTEAQSAKSGIYQTDVFGAKAYHAKCMEPNCKWESKRFDRIKQAQAAAEKHSQVHFKQGVAEGIARGPKEKKLYDLLSSWLHFISFKTVKVPNDAIDANGRQILASMQKHYLGPVVNGMSMGEILKGDLWQNPKVIPHLLKYIYQGIPYIEERIKKFVKPSEQQNYLSAIEKIKQLYKESVAQYSQGVAEDPVDEMALSTYKTMGDFSKPGPFTGADKKLVPHPKNIEKATRFFEQTPFDFRLFFSNIPGTGKYSEHGPMTPDELRKVFGKDAEEIIAGSENAITVVYVGNKGDRKVMLTPWMMAHRFGHAVNRGTYKAGSVGPWQEAEKHFFTTVNNLLNEYYGKVDKFPDSGYGRPKSERMNFNLTPEYNALFNAIGTQRSSRSGEIRRPYEFFYELFAQYLGTGKVTLNPFPTNLTYGRKAWGNPTKFMNIKPEYRDETERKYAAEVLARDMEILFNDVLSNCVGKIYVM